MKKIAFACALLLAQSLCAQTAQRAESAYDFLQSIGVNSAIYRRGENVERTIECINYIGARWIRTDESMNSDQKEQTIKRLHLETGIRISTSLGSGGSDIDDLIAGSRRMAKLGVLLAIEGNNEPNNWGITYGGEKGGRQESWAPVARLHRDLYKAVKADNLLRNYPVWSTTETGAMTDNVGLQYAEVPSDKRVIEEFQNAKFADALNCHNYFVHPAWPAPQNNQTWMASDPSGMAKADHLYGNFGRTWLRKYDGYSEGQLKKFPRVTTETGATISGKMTEELQARMYLTCYLAQFAQGWSHTAMYILRDRTDEGGNQSFGFFDKNYRPRLAAHYLHNLTSILKDERRPRRYGRLRYGIQNSSPEVHDLLLQKSNGRFFLIVWGEFFEEGSKEVTVEFGKEHHIGIYNPTKGVECLKKGVMKSLKLKLDTSPYIIEIKKSE